MMLSRVRRAFFLAGFCAWGICFADTAGDIEAITGSHTRIVWARGVTAVTDADALTANYALMGFDTRAGGEHQILHGPASFANPWVTPDGSRVVYTDCPANAVYVVGWNGNGKRRLAEGFGLCVWADPVDGSEWVYVCDTVYGSSVRRYLIDSTDVKELVWDKTPVSIRFRVSADGTRAGGEFPWNKAGIATLPNGTFTKYGSGCNAMIAPDNSYRFFHMIGTHREIVFYDSGGTNERTIAIDHAPGIDGAKVWIPKWSNDARFFTLAGPGSVDSVHHNIYIGMFDSAFTYVKKWARVTDDPDTYDIYAHAWIGHRPQLVLDPPGLAFLFDSDGSGTREREVMLTSYHPLPESLELGSKAPWLEISARRDTNGFVITTTVTPEILESGVHQTVVTIAGDGLAPSTLPVELRIEGPPRLFDVTVFPGEATVFGVDTITFSAAPTDQFGEPFEAGVTWEVTGGGSISPEGVLVTTGERGTYAVRARAQQDQAIFGKAIVSVYDSIILHEPRPGDVFETGRALCIRWDADTACVHGVSIFLSLDSGISWTSITGTSAVTTSDTMWGDYCLTLPDSVDIGGEIRSAASDHCRIRVCSYPNGPAEAVTNGDFSIHKNLAIDFHRPGRAPAVPHIYVLPGKRILMRVEAAEYRAVLVDMRGAIHASVSAREKRTITLTSGTISQGVYFARVVTPSHTTVHRIVVLR
ncbi:MAG: hypothetical protein GF418_10960 [Chitinivibrionales bacterium]|nr:hypothetical protein [Chitinivibrionales bacterium]MBD3396135.1 hypothetical protein [Chitinivibrionales bacterium]